MDSQLATVLTSGSLDVQNGSQHAEGSGPVKEVFVDPKKKSLSSAPPGNLQPCPLKAATSRQDALSINGEMPEVGGTSKPASQEKSEIGGFKQPITVKTGVPVLRSQPIRIKIVVPPRCKRPITNSTISLTKDFSHSRFTRPVLVSSGTIKTEKNTSKITIAPFSSAMKTEKEKETKAVAISKTEEPKVESFHRLEEKENGKTCEERDDIDANIKHAVVPETPFVASTDVTHAQCQQGIKEERADTKLTLISQTMDLKACTSKELEVIGMEEQTEPLDLSLPKKREIKERRYGRFLDDSGCESSLIMEVDEFEGEGDRDVVEEDDGDIEVEDSEFHMGGKDAFGNSLLSPSFFSTSVFSSLSSIECDTENLLLIDDQGIPYTLSPDGHKVPQVEASMSEDPPSDQPVVQPETERKVSSQLATLAGPNLSQSSDNALHTLNAPSGDLYPSPASATRSPSLDVEQSKAAELFTSAQLVKGSEPSKALEPCIKVVHEATAAPSQPSGISLPNQPIQILTNPTTNTPILLLSSSSSPQLSSAPVGLPLPLSVAQSSPGASTPMLLLLSSVPSSSGESATTSTPIAVLDPSTGQLSQITASSAPISLPLPSGQVSTLGSSLSTISHPVIRLSPNNPPVVLSGVTNNINSAPILTSVSVSSSAPALQTNNLISTVHSTTPLTHTQTNSSDSNSGIEAISTEEVSTENNKPSTSTTASSSSPHPQSASLTFDLGQPSSEAEDQSSALEPKFDPSDMPSEHVPLEDHLYFSNTAAPPSPPIGPILPSGQLDSLDPLDPLSPATSPGSLGPRRVLYCQLCPRVFFYLSDLERHAITHSQKKPHVCQQCGKAFKRSSHLQRHKHIHTGQRNYVCPICAKRFREAGELQRHQRVHTGEKPYQCQLCHTRFAERNTLRRHTKRKHPYHQVAMEMLSERRGGGGAERQKQKSPFILVE
ncbi:mucin-17 [Myripristis murdjan]|uniref:mucin-17 n=1 Tax=Myripristis murdjan TaxID=586833 RepID=UPI00117637B1|nr:mucin-17-like [Myripristis murdjan]